ncbi:MAG: L-threonylcarbamoyladenylate synthase [Actinomycetes bacterium]
MSADSEGFAIPHAAQNRVADYQQVSAEFPQPELIRYAAGLLGRGALVAFPTETVYGLGAQASDPVAVRDVFLAKGRPLTDPLILHVAQVQQVHELVSVFPETAAQLASQFWPGPLTLVLPRHPDVLDLVTASQPTVAVRIPSHPVAQALLIEAGFAVAAPSANRFGRISPTSAAHVISELAGEYDLLLDGGTTTVGVESTVVDLSGEVPRLLRPGGVTLEQLSAVVDQIEYVERRVAPEAENVSAPGQFLRHYSPATPMVLFEAGDAQARQLIAALSERDVTAQIVKIPQDPVVAARELYQILRQADDSKCQLLLVPPTEPSGIGTAVNDRLFRAAQGRSLSDFSNESVRIALSIVLAVTA